MAKENTGIKMLVGGRGYSLSFDGGSRGYSLAGSGKGYSLTNRLEGSSRMGYSQMTPKGYANAAIQMKGYSIRQAYPVSLFPVPYSRLEGALRNEMFRKYRKKCPMCGNESGESASSSHYSLN